DTVAFDFDGLEDVRLKVEVAVVADEPGVAVDVDHADVLTIAHEHAQGAAVASRLAARNGQVDHAWFKGQALGDGGQFAGRDPVGEGWYLLCSPRRSG